jgi:UV DNA damage endonuclease
MTRFGYACVSQLTGRSTNHTCQLKSATPEKLRSLIARNLTDLRAILEHNLAHGWLLFRIGSSCIPFASHPVNTLRWWDEFAEPLAEIGAFARANKMRLMMHPGQYTILNSPSEQTRQAARAELDYSVRLLEALGMDQQHKVVIHVGGVYGDKAAASAFFVQQAAQLSARIHRRLTLEHEERGYTLEDVLSISQQSGLPVVYDNLHHALNPGERPLVELLPQVFASWGTDDGPPEVHFSSQAADARPGTHAHNADPAEFSAVLRRCAAVGDFDLMLEAKGKDAALQMVLQSVKGNEYA